MKILVTLGGECFDAEYIDVGHADGRDGVLYCFTLKDLTGKDRGQRNVSLFRSGTDRVFIENYEARVEAVRLNVLRRAFDSGVFTFETPVVPDRYHELRLRVADFQPQKLASDEDIRRFLKFGGYWLGYKHRQMGPNNFVDFNCAEDFDYLGATPKDMARNLWRLSEQGYFRPTTLSFDRSLWAIPTAKLIEEIEAPPNDAMPDQARGGSVTQHFYYLQGHNPRVNVNATDNSVNITSVSDDQLFVRLREAASSVTNEEDLSKIVARLDELERAKGTASFLPAYQNFIAAVANHMTVFGPFLPALAQMLSGGS